MNQQRDQARADMVAYAKALAAGRHQQALQIEQRYELDGYPPEIVSVGLRAAVDGRDHQAAVEDYLEGAD